MPEILSSPRRITEQAWPEKIAPLVTVLCTSYNHDRFIRDAMDGFLAQKTTFPVEIIVHDDASTDRTATTIEEYATAYPDLIRTILQSENQYHRGWRATQILLPAIRGKYVALCEGDDYWTSADKLQTQVALLEQRPDASACIHRADGRFEEKDETVPGLFGPDDARSEYGIDDLLARGNFVPTASIMMRYDVYKRLPEWLPSAPHNDYVILCMAALAGPVLHIDRSMSVYRKHEGGIHSSEVRALQALNCIRTLVVLGEEYDLYGMDSFRDGFGMRMTELEHEVERYEAKVEALENRHQDDRKTMHVIMESRTFKVGRALSRFRDRLPLVRRS